MAVLLRFSVSPASQDQFNQFDARVGQAMGEAGGPPAGLMAHLVYPDGGGFVVDDVWRSEPEGRSYLDQTLRPLIAELSLDAAEITVHPIWSFARP
jgi:hypothetical protein